MNLPAGCLAAPISASDAGAPLRLCAVLRRAGDSEPGTLVSLGEDGDASRFLGCITDAGGRVREWLEWGVQTVDFPPVSANREAVNNAALDAAWTRRALALRDRAPEQFVQTGWESAHPAPMLLDPKGGEPAGAATWELCRDDVALEAAGLPAYAASLHRYLWRKDAEGGGAPRFLPATPDAPDAEGSIGAEFPGFIPFNPAGGFLLARLFLPLSLEAFSDALGGRPWPGLPQGRELVPLARPYEALRHIEEPENAGAHLFSARRGRAGRLLEVFHLKLCLLLEAARAVRGQVAATRLPMLDVSSASFSVTLADVASGLPTLWTARPVLVQPGNALALPVPNAGEEVRYYLPAASGPTLYRPAAFGRLTGGRATVRLRKVRAAADEPVEVEGTLIAEENLPEAVSDLLRLHLRLGDGERVTLYGHLETKEGLTAGEARFRTVPQALSPTAAAALKKAEGAPFAGVTFEILPLLGSPCDLYALGVVAVRLLLVNDANTLAEALDETQSLARQADAAGTEGPLEQRLGACFAADPRWTAALGAQRLLRADASGELLPADLWHSVLATIIHCFPGAGPESTCRDLGDAPSGAPEAVFDRLIHDLEALTARTRSLVVIDWQQNREIRTAIRRASGKTG